MEKHRVIFWFDYPPKVEKGSFNRFTEIWPKEVIYVILNDLRKERKDIHWDDDQYGNARLIKLYESDHVEEEIKKIFSEFKDDIHILNGFNTPIVLKIKKYIFNERVKSVLFTERPVYTGNWVERQIKKILLRFKYTRLCKEYSPHISALLPLGQQGCKEYIKCKFPKGKIFNFMYCPPLIDLSSQRDVMVHSPLRFLYVGRFYYKTKGTDVLMKAVKYLKGSWKLDMAGGYGSDSEDVKGIISQYSQINYLGMWDSVQVVKNMQDYDVVIIPSKADGWNLLVNEALHSGIGIITSDQAVSQEVIQNKNAGIIFKSGNYKQLAYEMNKTIDNPERVLEWMQNGKKLTSKINDVVVGKYFCDIINNVFYNGERPQCPWL